MSGIADDVVLARQRELMDALFSPAGRDDPHEALRSVPVPGCRYTFVREALHDRRFIAPTVPPSDDRLFQLLARFMPRLPPDRHRTVRAKFAGLFSPRRIERYRDQVKSRANELIDAMMAAHDDRRADLAAEFGRPLPFTIIAEVLGVPTDDHGWLAEQIDLVGRGFAGQRQRPPVEAANNAIRELDDYFAQLIGDRSTRPADDLLTLLATGPDDGRDRADVLANCIFFILAGFNTTTTLLCAGTDLLTSHPDQAGQLRDDPSGWPSAVEEMLRYISPITLTAAQPVTDAVIDGHTIPARQQRILAYAAANRDPAVFTDAENFDITRSSNPHLAFSAGASFCLGAPLARLHGEEGLRTLFTRLPHLQLDGPLTWRGSTPVRQVDKLPIRWQ